MKKLPYLSPYLRYGKQLAQYAMFFRSLALAVDADPNVILQYCDHPAVEYLINDQHSTTVQRTHYLEALAYGDPGVMLACPGPSLSGLIMRELGTSTQIESFYKHLAHTKCRTFFALTEPEKGSDAAALTCQLTKLSATQYRLNGQKCFFGNGSVGEMGVILARTHAGPLGIRAVFIPPDKLSAAKTIKRQALKMNGLKGAQIASMSFHDYTVSADELLGEHLPLTRRGMMAIIKTFNRLRTGVGALAIGQAQAVLDHCYEYKKHWSKQEKQLYRKHYDQIDKARVLLQEAAGQIDQNPYDEAAISLAKYQATQIAEAAITAAQHLFAPAYFLQNEWLCKCLRDVYAWEYMEGTSHIQLNNIFHAIDHAYAATS